MTICSAPESVKRSHRSSRLRGRPAARFTQPRIWVRHATVRRGSDSNSLRCRAFGKASARMPSTDRSGSHCNVSHTCSAGQTHSTAFITGSAPSQTRARAPCARCSSSTRGATDAGLRGLGAAGTSVAIMACAVVVIAVVVDGADGIDGADAEVIDGIEGAGATGVVDVAGVGAAGDADAAGDASSGMRGSVTSVMACLSQI